jgi:hypothetical protein
VLVATLFLTPEVRIHRFLRSSLQPLPVIGVVCSGQLGMVIRGLRVPKLSHLSVAHAREGRSGEDYSSVLSN